MENALAALQILLAGWIIAGLLLGLLGGFDFVRRAGKGEEKRTPVYWMTWIVLYPVILLRALIRAVWLTLTPR